jgi:phenylalanyl-tRNA synthetase beta chain
MRGRTAEILLKGRSVGVIGEISPVMLNKFQLLYPVALAELDVDALLEVI